LKGKVAELRATIAAWNERALGAARAVGYIPQASW